ncbi:MAG: hypothetical protein KTR14_07925 [Vampirovibrio sp.]|nr:hypothetical protein [Vampirovibrio sp.]
MRHGSNSLKTDQKGEQNNITGKSSPRTWQLAQKILLAVQQQHNLSPQDQEIFYHLIKAALEQNQRLHQLLSIFNIQPGSTEEENLKAVEQSILRLIDIKNMLSHQLYQVGRTPDNNATFLEELLSQFGQKPIRQPV